MTERVEICPEDEHDGNIPVLQHHQARHNLRHFGISYNNEQHEYYPATM